MFSSGWSPFEDWFPMAHSVQVLLPSVAHCWSSIVCATKIQYKLLSVCTGWTVDWLTGLKLYDSLYITYCRSFQTFSPAHLLTKQNQTQHKKAHKISKIPRLTQNARKMLNLDHLVRKRMFHCSCECYKINVNGDGSKTAKKSQKY